MPTTVALYYEVERGVTLNFDGLSYHCSRLSSEYVTSPSFVRSSRGIDSSHLIGISLLARCDVRGCASCFWG
jgi:hypothetical protein